MNVVIMSRTKENLERVAAEIADATGRRVKVVVTDFVQDDVFAEVEEQLKGLDVGVLVNNVGILPSAVPGKFLDSPDLEQTITRVVNCNMKTMAKMCKIILPGMKSRGRGVILNMSSGVWCIQLPLYTLYAASKLFVERFSQGLQAEYKDVGIIIQAVAPFGISTRMAAYQKANMVTLTPEDFVRRSLLYLRAGDKTRGSVCHTVLGWLLQCVPLQLLYTEPVLHGIQNFVKRRTEEIAAMPPLESEAGKIQTRKRTSGCEKATDAADTCRDGETVA
ncbi:17-beta-hydroxysteroid dehydrogenase type 3 isoform X2 [Betta splendens]|nr:17-beta-hydroxysteroid dehydrogenase type 3 isoform X2 [Betta splendens]